MAERLEGRSAVDGKEGGFLVRRSPVVNGSSYIHSRGEFLLCGK